MAGRESFLPKISKGRVFLENNTEQRVLYGSGDFGGTVGFGRISLRPQATAVIRGSADYPGIRGRVSFAEARGGVVVITELYGLPAGGDTCTEKRIFALHIHEGVRCAPTSGEEPFSEAGGHFNPNRCPHPYHAGDLPPVFSSNGFAWSAVYLSRFTLEEIIGKTVILHDGMDDFTSQPAGNAGSRIACGVIRRV